MRRLGFLLSVLVALAVPLRGQTIEQEVKAADTARVLATLRGDANRLDRLLSDGLSYCHADGIVQTKAVYLAAVRTNRIKYDNYDIRDTRIIPVSDDVAIMSGKVHLKASSGPERVEFDLRFLAVWRREDGVWRLFAYQSSRLSDPTVIQSEGPAPVRR